jgi:hypothetical protein
MRSSGHFVLLGLTGHLCPPVRVGSSYWSPVSVRPVFFPVCPLVCSLCLLCVFALPVYSRLRSLLRRYSVSIAYTSDVTLSRTLHFSYCRTLLCGNYECVYYDRGGQHNYNVSSIFRLQISQYSEGPATGHLDTGFSWFPCVYKQVLRWFPSLQVATTCFSCSPPD